MSVLDWIVLAASLVFVIGYGLWRSRSTSTTEQYLLAGREMPWYAMALSIMATQASAITFISTTGQAYADGMRFLQMYLGLPLAMILISATAVPIFHRARVYTAYEYLEHRFDAKTRTLVSIVFLIQRGLGAGVALYAPAIVLTVIFGWPDYLTTAIMGALVVLYTTLGGIRAVTWTDFQQMLIMMAGLIAALCTAIWLMPADVSFLDAVRTAGAAGRLNALVTSFSWSDQYNIFSGLLGGMFLALAYFGCDQSQVQRYLTGRSIAQSRLSLLFNAVAKLPMQFLILFTGAMVFVFYIHSQPPLIFHPGEMAKVERRADAGLLRQRFDRAWQARREATHTAAGFDQRAFQAAQSEIDSVRKSTGASNDTNFIFLTFVTHHLPAGLVGLVMACIFAAAMSTISAEVNSLATVTVIDIYKRHMKPEASDGHYLWASRLFTALWGVYAVFAAGFGRSLGSLIEAVNMVGSFFYGSLLGAFMLAFYAPRVGAHAAFLAILLGEAAVVAVHFNFKVAFLWYNVVGAAAVVIAGLLLSFVLPRSPASSPTR
ncbi:MAG: sodium:solute symporter [Bryobacterales bacterium]|nr:sodium:solute symporter [Bryobacterales bacterium]